MFGQFTKRIGHVASLGENDAGVTDCVTAEPGADHVDRPVGTPTVRIGRRTGVTCFVVGLERKRELQRALIGELRDRDGKQGDVPFG